MPLKIDSSSELEPKVESNLLMESSNELNLGVEKIFFQSKLVSENSDQAFLKLLLSKIILDFSGAAEIRPVAHLKNH